MTVKTKYSLGNIVWLMHNNHVRSATIRSITISIRTYEPQISTTYYLDLIKIVDKKTNRTLLSSEALNEPYYEKNLFTSARALISSLNH